MSKIHAKSIGESEDEKSSRLRERNFLDKLVIRATTELKNAHIMQMIKELNKKLETAGSEEEMELMNRFLQLQDLKKVLAKNLGERIILKY